MKPYVKMMLMDYGKNEESNRREGSGGYSRKENDSRRMGYDSMMEDDRQGYDRPSMGDEYEVDSRFTDRRGRRHYDDGRFAPMPNRRGGGRGPRNEFRYMEMNEEGRRGGNGGGNRGERSRGMEMNKYREDNIRQPSKTEENEEDEEMRGDYWPIPPYSVPPYGGGDGVKEIGFERGMRTEYTGGNEMENRWSEKESGYAEGGGEFTKEEAKEWTKRMHNEDGTTGPHWSMEQAKQVMTQRDIKHDEVAFWAILNSIYSDYCAVFKKHGVNTMDMYIDMTKAWLDDKDAVKDKAGAYYECVVKH